MWRQDTKSANKLRCDKMLSVEIVAIGKLGQPFLKDGCEEYIKRTRGFYNIKVIEVKEGKASLSDAAAEHKALLSEEKGLLAALGKNERRVAALAVEGERVSSNKFADLLDEEQGRGGGLVFVIGGSLGLSDGIKKRADMLISLSDMTFTHQFSRLILLEQIYRAATINNRMKYHK